VGDVKQAIYGWRGGVAAIFDAVHAELSELQSLDLAKTYRSSQPIVDAVNQVFQNLTCHPHLDKLAEPVARWQKGFPEHSTARAELKGYVELATAPEAGDGERQTDVTLHYAAQRVQSLVQAAPAATVGVLVRTNAAVAEALGVAADALDTSLPIRTVSTGLPFAVVPFRSLAALSRVNVDARRAAAWLARRDARFFYLVCRETVDPAAGLHARMIFYGGEDPATGSAAGCCAAWMVKHGVAAPGQAVLIEQGLEARRPSWIHVRASAGGAGATDVLVGGHVVEVARGELVF
jgi:hypothetical protein